MRNHRVRYFLIAAALVAGVATVERFEAAPTAETIVTYSHETLHANIPYDLPNTGSGQLTVDILDPEDRVVGHSAQTTASAGKGSWQVDVRLAKPIATDELVWHRLRYRFAYESRSDTPVEGIYSISQILRRPVVHILGQNAYLTGGPAAIRVIVTDSNNRAIDGANSVRIELQGPSREPRVLFAGRLNRRGTTEAQFGMPAGVAGDYALHYVVDTPIGSTEFTQPVRLEDKASILLTTEKPVYQPGQTIHVRALALDRSNREAVSGRKLTFEVEDSRGNKVFKNATQTGKFGIASAEFSLADEVNLGTYHLRALMGDAGSTNTAEIALNVERYVLPKFKVAVDFAGGKDVQAKHGYRPGDHVTGTVRVNYFFGKSVDHAAITVKASSMDVAAFEAAAVHGNTDEEGTYRFDLPLPRFFAGRPLSHGAAQVLIEAEVKDAAGHTETRGEPITVSESPLILTAVPEGGTLIPNLENQVFVLASYADGKPAQADLRVRAAGNPDQNVSTDAAGVAMVRIKTAERPEALQVEARDKEGNRVAKSLQLDSRPGEEQILLRAERAVYKAGERIQLGIFSTKKRGTVYLDVVKEGQTVLTRDLDIVDGRAAVAFTATPELAGTLDFNAYSFGADARPVADHRLIFVQPADELKIEAATDAAVYKPGDDARIRFRVTNGKGEGVRAALGVQVVDEAVFALAEKQPGFAKVFFYLEQEAMKPRYESHSIGMADAITQAGPDRAARALFSATELVNPHKFETEVGRAVPEAKRAEFAQRYQVRFNQHIQKLAVRLSGAYVQNPEGGDLTKIFASLIDTPELRDAWSTKIQIEPVAWAPKTYLVRSAGPDRQLNTPDDLAAFLQVRAGAFVNPLKESRVELNLEHDRGPFNSLGEIAGSVVDPNGAAIPAAVVTVTETSSRKSRAAKTDAAGQFSLEGVPAGSYQVEVSSSGFAGAARQISLVARDRAVVSARLQLASMMEAVIVTGAPAQRMRFGGNVAFAGFGGGGGLVGLARGTVVGGIGGAVPAPMMAQATLGLARAEFLPSAGLVLNSAIAKQAPAAARRVRSYFPEALYVHPEIITDQNGAASISIPIADSITTWRMAMLASTTRGALGSATSSIKVFQDFFADLDLPVTLTQGDRVSVPVAVYNYSGERGDVSLKLQNEDWFALVEDVPDKTLAVDSGRVGGSQFTLEAKRIGKFKLTLSARMKDRADIVVREIEVIPNGRERNITFNGRLENSVEHDLNFPANSVPDAGKILVRLYPGPLSQVIEGMDALLRMPGGCFEQTSSTTYPNVLALDYMKRIKKLTPEVHAKAEGFIANGYQRLVTFEVPGGGFSWFGQAPANKILTAYGLMEFYDMSQVHDVDPKLIARTQQWLAAQQQADGSWRPDQSFINEGATNRYNSDVLRITAYVAWSLENTGYRGPAVEKARQFVQKNMTAKPDLYTTAVVANFAVDYGKDRDFTNQAIELLLAARTEKDDQVWWTAEETGVYGRGASAAVETTGLAVQALLKSGQSSGTVQKALSYIASKKDSAGTWGTTQATIMALRALLLASGKNGADVRGTVDITLDGKPVQKLELTAENNDLLHQFVFKATNKVRVQIHFTGQGGLAYQVVGRYFVPWVIPGDQKPSGEPISIDVSYDRTRLAQDDIATATATVRNNLTKTANMIMVDLGIPPGFDLLSEDLQSYQESSAGRKSGRLEKFNLTATQAILYFDSIAAAETVTLKFRLRAKYPIRARTFASRVYEYYDPEVNSVARPVQLEVRKR